jgi:tetratricopeptide (TPR) repeat protein
MMRFGRLGCSALAVVCGAALCGCFSSSQSASDEEKEPHYLAGKARVNALDYKGAVESFEKALEVNPRSASAHFELGLLCEKNEQDYAAAIYHFERYLKLRPNAGNVDILQPRILGCKQELAKTVSLGPVTQEQQRQFEQLTEDNRRLREELEKWKAYAASRGVAPTNPPAPPGPGTRAVQISGSAKSAQPATGQQTLASAGRSPAGGAAAGGGSPATARTHKIQSGDNPSSIARKYGVKLDALMAANPGLDPHRMRPGQTLNIPPS